MAFSLTEPSMTDADWPTFAANIRENFRSVVQTDSGVFAGPLLWNSATQLRIGAATPSARLHLGAGGTGTGAEFLLIDSGSGSGGHSGIEFGRNGSITGYIVRVGQAAIFIGGDAVNDLDIRNSQAINFCADGATLHAQLKSTGSWAFQGAAATNLLFDFTGSTTAITRMRMTNTSGDMQVGVESSGGGTLLTGAAAYSAVLMSIANQHLQFGTNSTLRMTISALGSFIHGTAALATTATSGFVYFATCAGAPTGVPVAWTGTVPMVYDTTNHKFWVYDTGTSTWKGVVLA